MIGEGLFFVIMLVCSPTEGYCQEVNWAERYLPFVYTEQRCKQEVEQFRAELARIVPRRITINGTYFHVVDIHCRASNTQPETDDWIRTVRDEEMKLVETACSPSIGLCIERTYWVPADVCEKFRMKVERQEGNTITIGTGPTLDPSMWTREYRFTEVVAECVPNEYK